jgi:chromosome segregation ATPase
VENPKDAKLGHHYRLAETLREEISAGTNSIDYLYYIERLMNDVDQIFSIGYMDDIKRKNTVRLTRELNNLGERLRVIEEKMKDTQTTIDRLERSIEKSSTEKDKELTAKKRELRTNKKMYSDLEKETQKIRKNQSLMETKGIETFDKKMNRSDLLLDERFFEHIVHHLTLRRQLVKEVATYTPKPKSELKLEKKPKQQTLSSWLK